MARDLPGNITNYFNSAEVWSTFPCGGGARRSGYWSAWIYPDTTTGDHWVVGAYDDVAGTVTSIGLRQSGSNIQIVRQQGSSKFSQVSGIVSGSWQHIFGSWGSTVSDNSAMYLDGGTPGTDATNKNPGDLKRTLIGAAVDGAGVIILPFDGKIAEVAIWDLEKTWAAINSGATNPTDVPATAKELEMAVFLAEGASPSFFPAGLVSYWKMDEPSGGIRDSQRDGTFIVQGNPNNLAEVGSVPYFPHPKIYYPGAVTYFIVSTGGTLHDGASTLSCSATVVVNATGITGASTLDGTAVVVSAALKTNNGASALDGVATIAAAALKTNNGVGALTGTATVAAAGTLDLVGASTFSGVATVVAAGTTTVQHAGVSALDGTAALVAAALKTNNGASVLDGVATVAAAALKTNNGASTLDGVATVLAAALKTNNGASTLSGTATVVAAAAVTSGIAGAATLAGTATVAAAGLLDVVGASTLSGSATFTTQGTISTAGASVLSGTAALVVAGSTGQQGASSLAGACSLTSSGTKSNLGIVALDGVTTVAAVATITSIGGAALDCTGSVVAAGTRSTTGTSSMTGTATIGIVLFQQKIFPDRAPHMAVPVYGQVVT